MHIYDYVIIGSGLTGLSIAAKIRQETENILILESQDTFGGSNRPAQLQNQNMTTGLRFFPATEASQKSIAFLENLLQQKIAENSVDNCPETYEASGFKPFVGFGDRSFDFYDQFSYFLAQKEMVLSLKPHEWVQKLQELVHDKIQTKSFVTKFGFEGLDSEKPHLSHVIVNGNKNIYANNFIFTGEVKDLSLLLPDDVFNPRHKAKLKKSKGWQAVCLDLVHKNLISKNNLFVLNGTTDDEVGPCLGRFSSLPDSEQQLSQWLSFIDSESAEETENIGLVLKKIKRQIKRAFPEVSENIIKERIFVTPPLSGTDIKLSANSTFPQVSNLWIASAQVSNQPNLLGSLQQAQLVLASMGFANVDYSTAEVSP